MRKIFNKKVLLIGAILLMVIGFASVTTSLFMNNGATIAVDWEQCKKIYFSKGGNGGGIVGNSGIKKGSSSTVPSGGTQTSRGISVSSVEAALGKFGYGGNEGTISRNKCGVAGGGSGYYGGAGGNTCDAEYSGAGGSSYIGDSRLTNKVMYCNDCVTSDNVETKTVSNSCSSKIPMINCAKEGNGKLVLHYWTKIIIYHY